MTIRQESKDFAWVSDNLKKLQNKYPGKYIAVSNEKVIAVADNWEDAERRAKQILIANDPLIIEYIETGDLYAFFISQKKNI